MITLGISCFYHDSAACLVRDGEVIAAAQEERFNRIKNTDVFPIEAINFCVQKAGIGFHQIDRVVWFEKPYLKFSRVLTAHLDVFPLGLSSFVRSMPKWLSERLFVPMLLEEKIDFRGELLFLRHHLSHAASAYYPSGFDEAAIIVADGVGEWATFSTGTARGHEIKLEKEIHYPHSLGLLYTTFTTFLGFHANGGEGKLMGLAGLGKPVYLPQLKKMVHVFPDGSFLLNPEFFQFLGKERSWTKKFTGLLGEPRKKDEVFSARHYDLAASIQALLEEIMILNVKLIHQRTGLTKLCLAGGVALNCVANAKILEETGIEEIFVQPAAGDAGAALGSALYYDLTVRKLPRGKQTHSFYGPEYSHSQIIKALKQKNLSYEEFSEDELLERTAQLLKENNVVGWFQGALEFGPRALGHRSILANPTFAGIKEVINDRVKKRESFRPYAPIVTFEDVEKYFDFNSESPFMLLAPRMNDIGKKTLPGIVHADGTARVQTCTQSSDPLMWKLLKKFEVISRVPVLINTSFNSREEPVVNTPEQAVACYLRSSMDALVLGNCLVMKKSSDGR
ncbi:MAG: carbamoyltransferase [Bacteriovoracaceae bacterium]